ncbi:MAG: monovalent cation/H(+) antiporter subunit G [Magnetovibrionaceae bacterium]
MAEILDLASWVLLMAGCLLCIIGAIGILRLPDVFSRLHGAGIIDTLGVMMVMAGLLLQAPSWIVAVKLVLVFVFIFFTSPTTTHALSRATLNSGQLPLIGNGNDKRAALKAQEFEPIVITPYKSDQTEMAERPGGASSKD